MITAPYLNQLSAATAAFAANVTDPKAGIIATYNFLLGQVGLPFYTSAEGLVSKLETLHSPGSL